MLSLTWKSTGFLYTITYNRTMSTNPSTGGFPCHLVHHFSWQKHQYGNLSVQSIANNIRMTARTNWSKTLYRQPSKQSEVAGNLWKEIAFSRAVICRHCNSIFTLGCKTGIPLESILMKMISNFRPGLCTTFSRPLTEVLLGKFSILTNTKACFRERPYAKLQPTNHR